MPPLTCDQCPVGWNIVSVSISRVDPQASVPQPSRVTSGPLYVCVSAFFFFFLSLHVSYFEAVLVLCFQCWSYTQASHFPMD